MEAAAARAALNPAMMGWRDGTEITPSAKTAQELRDMGLIGAQMYTQLQAADAMRDAANAPRGTSPGFSYPDRRET